LGDTFTWVGLALLSYQFGKENAAVILASALTLRVVALFCFLLLQEYWLTKSTERSFYFGAKGISTAVRRRHCFTECSSGCLSGKGD
jgi:hypothetical protein